MDPDLGGRVTLGSVPGGILPGSGRLLRAEAVSTAGVEAVGAL